MRKLVLILVFLFIFLPSVGLAADAYVSNGGNDNNPGTEAQPFANIPYTTDCGGSGCSAYTASAGDIIYLNKGDSWTISDGGGEHAQCSGVGLKVEGIAGTSGSPITITSYGSGADPVLAAGSGVDCLVMIGSEGSNKVEYITIDGLDINANDRAIAVWIGVQGGATQNTENIIVQNSTIRNNDGVGFWAPLVHLQSQALGYNVESCTIQYNDIYNARNHNVSLYSSDPPAYAGNFGETKNNYVRGNTIHNDSAGASPQYGIQFTTYGSGNVAEFNVLYGAFREGPLCLEGGGYSGPGGQTDSHWRYNIIRDATIAQYIGGFYAACQGLSTSGKVYGNIFYNLNRTAIIRGTTATCSGTVTVEVYNNIIYDVDETAINFGNDAKFVVNGLRNNIISVTNVNALYVGPNTDFDAADHSNNIMYRSSGAGDTVVNFKGSTYTRSTYTNWEASGFSVDPSFKNTSNLPTSFSGTYGTDMVPDNDGLSIESGTALDGGTDLGGTPYYGAINLSGTNSVETRDALTPWDIGAYEYGSGVPDTTPPTRSGAGIAFGN